MKRRDLIALVSLELFNHYGEANLTAVDIANELEISPGNLYYHFHGKEQILAEIVSQFEAKMKLALDFDHHDQSLLVSGWLHLYVFLELLFAYRFLFRNSEELSERYPDIGKRVARAQKSIRVALQGWIVDLCKGQQLAQVATKSELINRLVDNLMLVMLFWVSFSRSLGHELDRNLFVEDASMQILSLLSPYLCEQDVAALVAVHSVYMSSLDSPQKNT